MRYAYTSVPTAAVLNTELEKQLYDIFLVGNYPMCLVLSLSCCLLRFVIASILLHPPCIPDILTYTSIIHTMLLLGFVVIRESVTDAGPEVTSYCHVPLSCELYVPASTTLLTSPSPLPLINTTLTIINIIITTTVTTSPYNPC